MRIAAYVKPHLYTKLDRIVTSDDVLFRAESWRTLIPILHQQRVDIAVLDPCAGESDNVHEVTKVASNFPDLPIVVYTDATPSAARWIITLNRASIRHVLLHPFEGTPKQFRQEMAHAIHDTLFSHFVVGLGDRVELLPTHLRKAVQRMFAKPEQFQTAGDLALHAEITPLQMYRYFDLAGLASPKQMLIAARLLRFYWHVKYVGLPQQGAAQRLGYPDRRVLSRYSLKVLGTTLSALPNVAEERLLSRLRETVIAK